MVTEFNKQQSTVSSGKGEDTLVPSSLFVNLGKASMMDRERKEELVRGREGKLLFLPFFQKIEE